MNPHYVAGAKKGWATRKQRDACWEAKHGMRKRPAGWKCKGEKRPDSDCKLCRARWAVLVLKHVADHRSLTIGDIEGARLAAELREHTSVSGD